MLKKRADFVAITAAARRVALPCLTLEWRPIPQDITASFRLGLTATRKLGNAVQRNRAKRRLRALARTQLPLWLKPGHDVVLVARAPCLTCTFPELKRSLYQALSRAKILQDGSVCDT